MIKMSEAVYLSVHISSIVADPSEDMIFPEIWTKIIEEFTHDLDSTRKSFLRSSFLKWPGASDGASI